VKAKLSRAAVGKRYFGGESPKINYNIIVNQPFLIALIVSFNRNNHLNRVKNSPKSKKKDRHENRSFYGKDTYINLGNSSLWSILK
jgi:hypothetical protein